MAIKIPGPSDISLVSGQAVPTSAPNAGQEYNALSNLTNSVQRLSNVMYERRQRAEDTASLAYIRSNADKAFNDDFETNKSLVDEADNTFIEKLSGAYESTQQRLVEGIKEQGYRPSAEALQRIDVELSTLRGNMITKASAYENNRRIEKATNTINDSLDGMAFSAYNNPELIDDFLNRSDETIKSSGELFSDATEKKRDSRHAIASRAMMGLIESDPAQALTILRDEKSVAKNIDTPARIKLINQAKTELERVDARVKADVNYRVKDATTAYMHGLDYDNPPSKAEFMIAYPNDGEQRYADFKKYQEISPIISNMPNQSAQEMKTTLAELKPRKDGTATKGFAVDAERYEFLVKSATNLEKQKQDDPAGFIMKHNNEYADLYKETIDGNFTTDEYAKLMIAEQERLGVPVPQIIPKAQAQKIALSFTTKDDGQNANDMMTGLANEWGKHWPTVYRQLSDDLPSGALVIGAISDDAAKTMIGSIANIKTEDLKSGIPNTSSSDINKSIDSKFVDMQRTLAQNGAAGRKTFAILNDEAKRLAYAYHSQGMSVSDASEKAYTAIVDDQYDIVQTYRIPKVVNGIEIDTDAVRRGASEAIRKLDADDFGFNMDDPELKGTSKSFIKNLFQDRVKQLRNQVYWVTNEDETGLVLYRDGQLIPGANGERIEVDFDTLSSIREDKIKPERFTNIK